MSARLFDQLQNFRRNPSGSSGEGGGGGGNGGEGGKRPLAAPADPETSRVKRALFGPVDHDENLRFVKRELQKNLAEQSKKYNFDFESGRPLKVEGGRWEWEVVSRVPPLPSSPPEAQLSESQGRREERRGQCDTTSIRGRGAGKGKTGTSEPPPDSLLSGSPPTPTTATPVTSSLPSAHPPAPPGVPTSSASSASTTTTASATAGAATTASRTSQRQTSITDHFSHRKRSRSKVKTQERKPEEQASPGSDPEEEGAAARPEVTN